MFKTIYYAGDRDDQQRVSIEDSKDAAFWSDFNNNKYLRVGVIGEGEAGRKLPETTIFLEVGNTKTYFEEDTFNWFGNLEELKDLLREATKENDLID